MAFRIPSATNTFSITWESTFMLVSATRDPGKFKLASYIQYVETKTKVYRYLKLDLDEPARVVTDQEYFWAPGQAAPTGDNIGAFQFVDSATVKRAYAWVLPDEAIDQAEWQLESSQMGIVAQKAMTNRTIKVASVAQTASNWPSTNTGTVSSLNDGAGKFDTASSDPLDTKFNAGKKAVTKAVETIVLQTNAVMKHSDLHFVISPLLARKWGNSAEVYGYTKGSPDAFDRQVGEEKYIGEYGMPAKYAGINIVVEDAVKVTSRPNITTGLATSGTRGWVWADASPVIMSRKGGVEGKYGGRSLSTIQLYYYRNMETYTKHDVDNERHMGRIVDDFDVVIPFGQSGYMMQAAV